MHCVRLTKKIASQHNVLYVNPIQFISATEVLNEQTKEIDTIVTTTGYSIEVVESAREVSNRVNIALGTVNVPTF